MWCCVSNAAKLEFGEGTVLFVTEADKVQKYPEVTIFPPNLQELKDKGSLSLVCVASGFYPEHVSIRWKVNGEVRVTYDQNKPILREKDTYSISRRLILTKQEYYTPSNTFRCEASFPGWENVTHKEINGEKKCTGATEFVRRKVNEGKISYILVLCKSALYGIIVAAVIFRKKMIGTSY
ncbi:T cell receptor beta [Pelobates cultripes]|nr:T cell receptor beta [Pelobates cultripes]